MKNILFVLLSITLLTSCLKEDPIKDYTKENEAEILSYLNENNLTANKDANGIYYIIEEEGTGEYPEYSDAVTVAYTGSFTNGDLFDEGSEEGVVFNLNQVISGWTIGMQYFKEGGKGKLIIPSRYGYGSSDYAGIPGGSVLVFDIELFSVNYNKENDTEITEYLSENNLTDSAIKTDSGLYYIIEEEGVGSTPVSTDNVTVTYTGYFSDNEIFDENLEGISFNLQNVIEGWKEGLTYFNEEGKGKLLIPSRLAYGNYTYAGIPGGSVLIFDIELISIDE